MVEAVGGRLRGCGGAVHHAMPTPNCNTSNTRVFDPFNPPTSGPQQLLAPHLIHGTVEQRIHILLLILTNLPPDCVAPTGGYVGDLQVQDRGYLTSFSIDGEHCLNTSSEATQSLSNVLRVDSNGRVLVKPYRRSSWLFSQFSCSQAQCLLSRPADQHRVR